MRRFFFTAKYIAVNNQKIVRLVLLMLLSKNIMGLWCKSELRTTLPFEVLGLTFKVQKTFNKTSFFIFDILNHFLYLVDKHKSEEFLVVFLI